MSTDASSEPRGEPPPEVRRSIAEFLVTNDAPCTVCGYNLRGLSELRCPECGQRPTIMGYDDFDDWVQRVRVVGYLQTHDLICTGCRANLRGTRSPECAGCGTLNAIPGASVADSLNGCERWFVLALIVSLGAVAGAVVLTAVVLLARS